MRHILGIDDIHATLEDIDDHEIKGILFNVRNSKSLDELLTILEKQTLVFHLAGCKTVIKELDDKEKLVEDFLKWYIIKRNAFGIELFMEGLKTLNVLEAMKQHPEVFLNQFCFTQKRVTAQALEDILALQFSDKGSNKRAVESRIIGYWIDYTIDAEGNLSPEGPSLRDILQFATGLSSIPPSGFHPHPSVQFLHNGSPYPITNTCGNIIHLPITTDYYTFQKNMDFGILNYPGFGRV
ncbi:G2/M phase-specific E3 ubiquitin-protein ligase-like [Acipenser ruthenus]|uniref:G2/M phase-specific E3 ubiquitin-protein ligase-like n=1 Tax=Acipenser ruthenus TaxID=7906 RepID=UPI0027419660|nr:G2/M phase-specific E3 ubiquitin-protein ligase-like [Acipenser ruthenus]